MADFPYTEIVIAGYQNGSNTIRIEYRPDTAGEEPQGIMEGTTEQDLTDLIVNWFRGHMAPNHTITARTAFVDGTDVTPAVPS